MKTTLKKIAKVLYHITAVAAIALWVVAFGLLFTQKPEPPVENLAHDVVRDVCVYAYLHDDGGSEEACGIAQNSARAQFVCTPDKCWVDDQPEPVQE